MRLANIADFRRRMVTKRDRWRLSVTRFAYDGIPGLGTHDVPISSPLTVISGANGVGKTSLLRAIWACAAPQLAEPSPGADHRLTAGKATLEFTWDQVASSSEVTFAAGHALGGSAIPTDVVHLDVSTDPLRHRREFCSFISRDDITNGFGEREVTGNALAEIKYICRRQYNRVSVYDIEANGETFPFFIVDADGLTYDSRTMGSGELVALYLWWRLDQATENALVLIEEPETFLSPISQGAVAEYIIATVVEKKLVAVVSSHSPKIIETIDEACRAFMFRAGSSSKLAFPPVTSALMESVGFTSPLKALIMVEDDVAATSLRTIVEKIKPEFLPSIEIRAQKGHGNLQAVLSQLANKFTRVPIVAVFDGDMRGTILHATNRGILESVVPYSAFLPGNVSIERLLRQFVSNNIESVKTSLAANDIDQILFRLEGIDDHDWLTGLARLSHNEPDRLLREILSLWLRFPENENLARATITELLAACEGKAHAPADPVSESPADQRQG